jgi:hypothetical protein
MVTLGSIFGARAATRMLRRAAATAVILATGLGSVAQAGPSGLAWQSGAACSFTEFEAWRGRPLDVYLVFAPNTTWAEFVQFYRGGWLNRYGPMPGKVSMSMPLISRQSAGPNKFSECHNGKFDKHFRDAARAIVGKGLGDSYIRLGWEAGNGSWPWYIGSKIDAYKKCWRRIATVLKSVSPKFKLEWVNARRGEQPFDIRRAYPGDDVVDVIGAHNYDRYPNYPNQTAWDEAFYSVTEYGQPRGMGAWLNWAKSRGKKFSVSEWAISKGFGQSGSTDNAFYISKMNEFFRKNAAHIEYESYFNCGEDLKYYQIHPTNKNPKAAWRYKQLFGK